jgi:hypothetical protein
MPPRPSGQLYLCQHCTAQQSALDNSAGLKGS